jgi:hypothetical protein
MGGHERMTYEDEVRHGIIDALYSHTILKYNIEIDPETDEKLITLILKPKGGMKE